MLITIIQHVITIIEINNIDILDLTPGFKKKLTN
jgi:hypothetical protein